MRRRSAIAPRTEMAVVLDRIRNLDRRANLLVQANDSFIQADDYQNIADPVPWELIVNRDGNHTAASDNSPLIYYHPGQEDGVGTLVSQGFKSLSGATSVASWIWAAATADGTLGTNHLTDGLVGRDIGNWYQISYGGEDFIATPNIANSDGSPFKFGSGGFRAIVITSLIIPTAPTFRLQLFPLADHVNENGVDDDFVTGRPNMFFLPAQWTGNIKPGMLQVVSQTLTSPNGAFWCYINNLESSSQSLPSGTELHMMGISYGTYELPVEEFFPDLP